MSNSIFKDERNMDILRELEDSITPEQWARLHVILVLLTKPLLTVLQPFMMVLDDDQRRLMKELSERMMTPPEVKS